MSRINSPFFVMPLVDGTTITLTHREMDCLSYLIRGFSYFSAGKHLNLCPRTVEFYVENVRAKLDYRTKEVLLAILNASRFNEKVQASFCF